MFSYTVKIYLRPALCKPFTCFKNKLLKMYYNATKTKSQKKKEEGVLTVTNFFKTDWVH